jgi:hypothetical protein
MTTTELYTNDIFIKTIQGLDDTDIMATSLVELGVMVNKNLPREYRLTETLWKNFVFDNVSPEIKVLEAYQDARQAFMEKQIETKKMLIKGVVEEKSNFIAQKGHEAMLKIRFPNLGAPLQESGGSITVGNMSILPVPPANLPPPPDSAQAAKDAENFRLEE